MFLQSSQHHWSKQWGRNLVQQFTVTLLQYSCCCCWWDEMKCLLSVCLSVCLSVSVWTVSWSSVHLRRVMSVWLKTLLIGETTAHPVSDDNDQRQFVRFDACSMPSVASSSSSSSSSNSWLIGVLLRSSHVKQRRHVWEKSLAVSFPNSLWLMFLACGTVLDMRLRSPGFESHLRLLRTNANSARHPSGIS